MFEEKVHSLIEMGNSSTGKTIYDVLKQEALNEERSVLILWDSVQTERQICDLSEIIL